MLGLHQPENSTEKSRKAHDEKRQLSPLSFYPYSRFIDYRRPTNKQKPSETYIEPASNRQTRQLIVDNKPAGRNWIREQLIIKTIDNRVGKALKKTLTESPLFSRTNSPVIPLRPKMRVYEDTTEEHDWKMALALSVNETVDSLSFEDKVIVLAEYNSIFSKSDDGQKSGRELGLENLPAEFLLKYGLQGMHSLFYIIKFRDL